jgi:alpha-beta hydrolase superfamily lysophospholipase
VPLTLKQFKYAFANTLSDQEAAQIYEEQYVPAATSVLFEVAFADLNPRTVVRADFEKADRAPMLFIAGEHDHVVPPSAVKANVKKYGKSKAVTDYKEFPGRTHYIAGQEGWEEVADYALDWVIAHTAPVELNGNAPLGNRQAQSAARSCQRI